MARRRRRMERAAFEGAAGVAPRIVETGKRRRRIPPEASRARSVHEPQRPHIYAPLLLEGPRSKPTAAAK